MGPQILALYPQPRRQQDRNFIRLPRHQTSQAPMPRLRNARMYTSNRPAKLRQYLHPYSAKQRRRQRIRPYHKREYITNLSNFGMLPSVTNPLPTDLLHLRRNRPTPRRPQRLRRPQPQPLSHKRRAPICLRRRAPRRRHLQRPRGRVDQRPSLLPCCRCH
jgi:hypothetical protein